MGKIGPEPDVPTFGAQPLKATPRNPWIGVAAGDPDLLHWRGEERRCAGRGSAMMVAGFERNDSDPRTIKGQRSACGRKGSGFSVRGAGALMRTCGHDCPCRIEENAADWRIGRRGALKGASQSQRLRESCGKTGRR
jgi:hypothetical protein